MSKKLRRILSVLLISIMLLSLFGCGQEPEAEEPDGGDVGEEGAIRIGFFAPVTGPAAADGLSTTNSAELAVDIINEQGGINGRLVELVKYDDGFDTKQAVNIAQKLITKDDVVAVVSGSYSGPTRVSAPIFQEAGMPMLAGYAVHPEVTGAGDFIFSQSFAGAVQGKAAAKVAVEMLEKKRISIIAVDVDFGKELSESFTEYAEARGAEVVSVDKVAMSDLEFTPIITKLKEEIKPDLIYMANYYEHSAEIARQVKKMGLDVPLIGTEGADSFQFLEIAGEDAEGIIITTNMNRDSEDQGTQDFIKNYIERYGIKPDMVGASVYDAFQVLFKVIGDVGTDNEAIKDAIANLTDFETVTGKLIRYASSRNAIKPVQLQIVEDGEFRFYGEIDDEEIIKQ
ncbi:MAG: ABC transporter substrate-binding protein [Tissierellia bacterium]|nr:ABC transporter substrate-binding protein [Tissierellia bacterium]